MSKRCCDSVISIVNVLVTILVSAVYVTAVQADDSWAVKVPPPPAAEQAARFGISDLDYQTTFCESRLGSRAAINNQTAVGLPGTLPMGFSYLMRLLYSEFEVNFSVLTVDGEKRPYLLGNFRQTSPTGWLPGAINEWDHDGIHYRVTYLMVPNQPLPIDLCEIVVKNTSDQESAAGLLVTLDTDPFATVEKDLIADREKPLAVMDPVVLVETLWRESGCLEPRAQAILPWHPNQVKEAQYRCRVAYYGLPIGYMLKPDRDKPLRIFLTHMSSHHLCDGVETTVEGEDAPRTLAIEHALVESSNAGKQKPCIQEFVGRDTDHDGYIKVSVRQRKENLFNRAVLNLIAAYDMDTAITPEETLTPDGRKKARHWIDVGADAPTELTMLSTQKDPAVHALQLCYTPQLKPGEQKKYYLKFPAIDRKEPAVLGYWIHPYDTGESWKPPVAPRHPANNTPYGKDVPPDRDVQDYAFYGPHSRSIWQEQLNTVRNLNWSQANSRLVDFWKQYLDAGAEFTLPDKTVENLYKHQVALLAIYRRQWSPHNYYMETVGPDFYAGFCARDGAYQVTAIDRAGHHPEARSIVDSLMTPLSKLSPLNPVYPIGQWDNGDPDLDGAWLSRPGQFDAQGQTLWTITDHYLLTGDKEWLSQHYPVILKGADWIIRFRHKCMAESKNPSAPGYGLISSGGLEGPGGGTAGVVPNLDAWNIFGLKRVRQMAEALSQTQDAARIDKEIKEYQAAFDQAIVAGFCRLSQFAGTIPAMLGTDNLTSWPSAAMVWPTETIAPHNPFINGWFQYRAHLGKSTGGLLDWPYIYTDQGIGYIRRAEYDKAADFFYCLVACASQTNDWFEEVRLDSEYPEFSPPRKGLRGGGDSPHGEACANYIHYLRSLLLHEQEDTLHIAPAIPRHWLAQNAPIIVRNAPSYFGTVSYRLMADSDRTTIRGDVKLDPKHKPAKLLIHVRGPGGKGLKSAKLNGKEWNAFYGDTIVVAEPDNVINMEVKYNID